MDSSIADSDVEWSFHSADVSWGTPNHSCNSVNSDESVSNDTLKGFFLIFFN